MYPFNPNYISDYKGYQLGMNVDEIDRLLAHREQSLYVNLAKEFQTITKISELKTEVTLHLAFISP